MPDPIDNLPLVSIIMPFYNAERFIGEAIQSVLSQTYQTWELLLIDDGSSDQSTPIARRYCEQYPEKVRYLEHSGHQNCGKSVSRNKGIHNAAGRYIAFLDSDDVWMPDILSDQVSILEHHPEAGMVYGPLQYWYSWSGQPADLQKDYAEELGIPPDSVIDPPVLLTLFLQDRAAVPSDVMVRREVIAQAGEFEDAFKMMYEDQVFIAKICLQTAVFASNKHWYRYRQHPDSSCAIGQLTGEYFDARPAFLSWLEQYLRKHQSQDPDLWRALNEELWPYRHPTLSGINKMGMDLIRTGKGAVLKIAQWTIPTPLRRWLWARWTGQEYIPPTGWVSLGNLRRLAPFSQDFGYDRGRPIDRYYIEKFLSDHQADIKGHVLEIADDMYTRQFGGERVHKSDVLHVAPGHPNTTIVADLTCASQVASNTFDCIILTQTLQFIYDTNAAIQTLFRILKPGGVVLATFPGISPISRYDLEHWGHYWGFTSLSARLLFENAFPAANIEIKTYGNVLTATAFLYGMAVEELKREELDFAGQDYEVTIAARAVKPQGAA